MNFNCSHLQSWKLLLTIIYHPLLLELLRISEKNSKVKGGVSTNFLTLSSLQGNMKFCQSFYVEIISTSYLAKQLNIPKLGRISTKFRFWTNWRQRKFLEAGEVADFFKTAFWLPHGQLWPTIEGKAFHSPNANNCITIYLIFTGRFGTETRLSSQWGLDQEPSNSYDIVILVHWTTLPWIVGTVLSFAFEMCWVFHFSFPRCY